MAQAVGLARLERLEPPAAKLLNGGAVTMEFVSWTWRAAWARGV